MGASAAFLLQEDNGPYQSAEEGDAEDTLEEGEGDDGAESEDGVFVELEGGAGAGGSSSSWGLPSAPSSEPSARNLAAAVRPSRLRPRPSSGAYCSVVPRSLPGTAPRLLVPCWGAKGWAGGWFLLCHTPTNTSQAQ